MTPSRSAGGAPPPARSARTIVLLEGALLLFAAGATYLLHRSYRLDAFEVFLAGYGSFALGTIVVMRIIRRRGSLRPGAFTQAADPEVLNAWRTFNFLGMNNLFPLYQNNLLPSIVRKYFARLLGARMAPGIISIGGPATDPYLVTLGKDTMIGQDTVLNPSIFHGDTLRLGEILVEEGAVVGARCVVMPDVRIGRYAMVKAMSLVEEGTRIGDWEIWGGVPARKMGQSPPGVPPPCFTEKAYMLLCGSVETAILGGAGFATWMAASRFGLDMFLTLVVFYVFQTALALLLLGAIRAVYPFREGVFDFSKDRWVCYRWNLFAFVGITNLFLHYQRDLIPPLLRTILTRMLGGRMRPRFFAAGGIVFDPFFVDVERGATVGYEALLLPHAIAPDALHLKPVRVERDAAVGSRALVMPGASIGRGAVIEPLSLVTAGTRVPAGEVWGGIPARKRGAAPRPPADPAARGWEWFWALAVESVILAGTFGGAALLYGLRPYGAFMGVVVLYGFFVALSLLAAKAIRTLFPMPEGEFTQATHPRECLLWRLHAFLCVNNLFLHYQNAVLPPFLRRIFVYMLGAKVDFRGFWSLGSSVIADAHHVTLGRDALLGTESLVSAVDVRADRLVVRRVTIGREASIGDRVVVCPGAEIGEGAEVLPLSLVEENTRIPAYEIWGGVPARKLRESRRFEVTETTAAKRP